VCARPAGRTPDHGSRRRERSFLYPAWFAVSAACVILPLVAGCATGIDHRVRPGENLFRIGKAYGEDYEMLARINHIFPPYTLKTGDVLFIPGATRQLPVSLITPKSRSAAPPRRSAPPVAVGSSSTARSGYGFSWPLRGRLTSRLHDGIDIAAARGTSILSARDGKVIYSDRLSGYGNVIIVEHTGGFASVYAHNDRNFARKGQRVRRGQKIASVGSTGRATGPHLHFEVRKDNVARNPLYYLPK